MRSEPPKLRRKANKYVKFSSLGIQMGLIIFVFTKGGLWLDSYFETETPWYTVGLSLTGVIGSLSLIIREVIKMNDNDSEKT
ncbi:MAG: AtpZ/AtpI family protein [Crocinitomicaceae bacterium]|jgi:ATP synthase protein I|nr:AtpZ/AtpI family protein [Crocinitomicaceae bacterium]